ncbi:hypothetical protein FIBSPDRAFT_846196 [Athelia psychrophila]|uniref:Uncharacterized protein n=1 Tax=Athelia psychrophila TaxID=1759441 RepID=A0A167SIW1_9AGAM|nr:hypothetical protein FIBSPDRAFT_846196 [Fibularhizoctonia sp. CBS 109695]
MADVDTDANVSVVCHHCGHPTSLTRPDINIRASSVPDALGCASRLAPSQAAAVNETVSATVEDISELDREVSRLQEAIKELQRKRIASQCFVHDLKSLFNPIARLPAEVLSQIFQQCVIVPWLERALNLDDPFDKTPLMVASVSRYWRNAALSTPRLWSALSLILRPKHAKRHMEIASLWLSRSKTSRISLHIETHGNIRDAMPKLTQLFASQSHRWRHIYFKLPFPM